MSARLDRRGAWWASVVALAAALAAAPLSGCGGCDDPPAGESAGVGPPKTLGAAKPAPDRAPEAGPPPTGVARTHRLAEGWGRTVPAEPDAEARGLYRRAIERVHAGAPDEATPLFTRIRKDFAGSRFASRLEGGGDPAATAALLGLAATVGAATFAGAMRQLETRGRAGEPRRP